MSTAERRLERLIERKPFRCLLCDRRFRTEQGCADHTRDMHGAVVEGRNG